MEQLSIEEKAKAYDIALKKIKMLLGTGNSCSREELEYVFPELAESEDEKVRNKLIEFFKGYSPDEEWWGNITQEDILAWLEKQGEHSRFREAIQVGDQVTKNEDGVLVNLSQLKRVAKPSEEQISVLSRSLKYINTISPNYCHVLEELLIQLKKLREE